jgi:hypothetical protein
MYVVFPPGAALKSKHSLDYEHKRIPHMRDMDNRLIAGEEKQLQNNPSF